MILDSFAPFVAHRRYACRCPTSILPLRWGSIVSNRASHVAASTSMPTRGSALCSSAREMKPSTFVSHEAKVASSFSRCFDIFFSSCSHESRLRWSLETRRVQDWGLIPCGAYLLLLTAHRRTRFGEGLPVKSSVYASCHLDGTAALLVVLLARMGIGVVAQVVRKADRAATAKDLVELDERDLYEMRGEG